MADFEVRGIGVLRLLLLPSAVDDKTAINLKTVLAESINSGGRKIICDMSRNTFLSSGAIGVLADWRKRLQKLEGELGFLHTAPAVQERFRKEGVAHLFKFYDLEESVSVLVLSVLVKYFDQYEDLGEIRTSRTGEEVRVEVVLQFDNSRTMREVQTLFDQIRKEVTDQQPQVELVLIAAAKTE